jgi:hypothetical protein
VRHLHPAHLSRPTDGLLCSGAFSNVYKALDLTLGTHVAGMPFPPLPATLMSPDPLLLVKAVRKFELTPSQVSVLFFPYISNPLHSTS